MNLSVINWLSGRDTGISSMAIVTVMEGGTVHEYTFPHDPADLGRCIRLLDIAPEYRENLDAMKQVGPHWSSLVDHWSELESLYYEELPTGRAPKCYARMRELIEQHIKLPDHIELKIKESRK